MWAIVLIHYLKPNSLYANASWFPNMVFITVGCFQCTTFTIILYHQKMIYMVNHHHPKTEQLLNHVAKSDKDGSISCTEAQWFSWTLHTNFSFTRIGMCTQMHPWLHYKATHLKTIRRHQSSWFTQEMTDGGIYITAYLQGMFYTRI